MGKVFVWEKEKQRDRKKCNVKRGKQLHGRKEKMEQEQ